jgi:hypothetical protein
MSRQQQHSHFQTCKLSPGFVLLAKVCPWVSIEKLARFKLTAKKQA